MNGRYVYLRARAQRMVRDLTTIVSECDTILARLNSTLIQTHRGKQNADIENGGKVELLRRRAKDAIMHLKVGTE